MESPTSPNKHEPQVPICADSLDEPVYIQQPHESTAHFLQQNEYYEDSFNSKQIQFLSQFFIDNPTCIFYGNAIVGQTILRLLHPSQFLAVYSDKWFLYD